MWDFYFLAMCPLPTSWDRVANGSDPGCWPIAKGRDVIEPEGRDHEIRTACLWDGLVARWLMAVHREACPPIRSIDLFAKSTAPALQDLARQALCWTAREIPGRPATDPALRRRAPGGAGGAAR